MMMHHRTTAQNFAFSPKKPTGKRGPGAWGIPVKVAVEFLRGFPQ